MSERAGRPTQARAAPEPPRSPSGRTSSPEAQTAGPDQRAAVQGEPRTIDIGGAPFRLSGDTGDEENQPPAPRSRTRTIVLGSLLAVGLAGASVVGYAGWRVAAEKDVTLTAPREVAGLRVDDSEDGRTTAEYLQTALSAEVDLDTAVGAVYSDGAGQSVLFFGGTTLIWTPEDDLDTAFDLVSDDERSVVGLHKVSPGKLGGTMKCGKTEGSDGDMVVCGWADHGSLALAMFPDRSEAESAKLLVQIRDTAQTRN
jgi:hypothetical protein